MSTPHIILDNSPSLCQKLLDLVEVWRSYNRNNFACFLRHGVVRNQSFFSGVIQPTLSKLTNTGEPKLHPKISIPDFIAPHRRKK